MEKDDVVNIPRDVVDLHYRYKMPTLTVNVEGRGNGIKTRLTNIVEVAKALDRSPVYLTKFFGFELGAQISSPGPDGGYLVNGKHDAADLANTLDRFIEKYVLCGRCRNPETVLYIKKDAPRMRCKACGHTTSGDVSHKIANYIVKFPPEDPNAVKKEADTESVEDLFGSEQKFSITNEDEDELLNDWAVSTEPGEVAKRQFALSGGHASSLFDDVSSEKKAEDGLSPISTSEGSDLLPKLSSEGSDLLRKLRKITPTENPLPILEEYWESKPTDSEAIFHITQISKRCQWSDDALLKNIFASMWLNFKPDGAILKGHYLSLFVRSKDPEIDDSRQRQILRHMETMATSSKPFALHFQDLLAMFWEERVLEVATIKKWFNHPNPKIPEKVSKFIRDRSQPVLKWLEDEPEGEEMPPINQR